MVETVGLLILSATGAGSISVGAGTLASATIFGVNVASVVGTVAIAAGTIGLQYALRPRPPKPEDGRQSKRLSISPCVAVFGMNRISGTFVCYEVGSDSSSIDVLALVRGKLSAVRGFFLHDNEVTLVNNIVQELAYDGRYGGNHIVIDYRLGLPTETAYAQAIALLPGVWTLAHRGDGIATAFLRCLSTKADQFQKIYPHGLPELSLNTSGFALWDFRDSGQDPDDPDTWVDYSAWSNATTYVVGDRVLYDGEVFISLVAGNLDNQPDESRAEWASVWRNPVIQTVNYLLDTNYGMGLSRATLITPPLANLVAQANLCDTRVLAKDGYRPRYQCDTFWTLDTDPGQILGQIMASCDGWMTEDVDGSLALYVGVYYEPTVTIATKDFLGFSVANEVADEDLVNELRGEFTSVPFSYRTTPTEAWRDTASVVEIGRVRSRPLDLQAVQSYNQARRIMKVAMTKLRSPRRGSVTVKMRAGLQVLGQRFVAIQRSGIAGLEDIVVELQNGRVDFKTQRCYFDWIKVDSTLYDFDATTEEGTEPLPADAAAAMELLTPQNVELVETAPGILYIEFDYLDRDDLTYSLRYRLVDDGTGTFGEWVSVPVVTGFTHTGSPGARTSFPIPFDTSAAAYEFAVASVNTRGTLSDYSSSAIYGIEQETVDLRARMTTAPSLARLTAIDDLIAALKAADAWNYMDGFYVLAAHDAQAASLNWKSNSFNLTVVGSLTFTTDRDYDGFTSSNYLNTGCIPATGPVALTLNDAHIGVYVRENATSASGDTGTAAATSQITINSRSAGDRIVGAVFSAATLTDATVITDSQGHTLLTRTTSGNVNVHKNGAAASANASTSDSLTTARPILFGAQNSSTPLASGRSVACGHFGRNVTTKASAIYTAIQAYMTAVGANV